MTRPVELGDGLAASAHAITAPADLPYCLVFQLVEQKVGVDPVDIAHSFDVAIVALNLIENRFPTQYSAVRLFVAGHHLNRPRQRPHKRDEFIELLLSHVGFGIGVGCELTCQRLGDFRIGQAQVPSHRRSQ